MTDILYCERADAITAGAAGDDTAIDNARLLASRIVDAYCGPSVEGPNFGNSAVGTLRLPDVRLPLVSVPGPFADVTEVKLNGTILDPSTYTVEEWGLRLYSEVPFDAGWPIRGGNSSIGRWPQMQNTAPFGAAVEVTATFGRPAIPALVTRATALLVRDITTDIFEPVAPGQVKLGVGQFDLAFDTQRPHPLDSTGDIEVDRLLRAFRADAVQVG